MKEAVAEIKKVARKDPLRAGDGAVTFLERVSPALEHVDSSSGAIGTAVNNAIATLVAVIATAPANARTRAAWLDRLWDAHEADQIPYIENLAEYWGELCAYAATMKAAESAGSVADTRERIRQLVAGETFGDRFVMGILGRELGL